MSETNWIEWRGGPCPIPTAYGHEYEIKMRGAADFVIRATAPAITRRWEHKERATDIVAYRCHPHL
jgi:hypothetical protein